jgi:hypothetical protein
LVLRESRRRIEAVEFARNPQAIGLITGLPLNPPGAETVIQIGTAILTGADVTIAACLWMDVNARTIRATYDLVLRATLVDASAGDVIKSQ